MSDLDFSRIPPGRVDALARQANAARAQAIARMPDDRRIATLVAFVSRLERTACDDALNLMDLELAKLLTEADRAGKAKRKKTLQTFDQAAVLLRDALLIVLDPTQEDLEHVREQLYARASHEELVKAVACVDQIARPHGTHHYEELISRYRSVRLFLPKLLELPFEGLPAGQIVLGGLAAVRTLEGRRRIGRDEIPGTLVTPTWERSVFVEPDQVERRSFTFCVLEQLRSALRRRDVFVSKSIQWGDPRAQLLGPTHGAKRAPRRVGCWDCLRRRSHSSRTSAGSSTNRTGAQPTAGGRTLRFGLRQPPSARNSSSPGWMDSRIHRVSWSSAR